MSFPESLSWRDDGHWVTLRVEADGLIVARTDALTVTIQILIVTTMLLAGACTSLRTDLRTGYKPK